MTLSLGASNSLPPPPEVAKTDLYKKLSQT